MILYTFLWSSLGVVPLGVNYVSRFDVLYAEFGPLFFGPALLILSAYQLSPYKYRCLDHCRSLSRTLPENASGNRESTLQFFRQFIRDDIGTCWVWMSMMVIIGTMNLFWMGLLTIALTFEQVGPRGKTFAKGIGFAAAGAGFGFIVLSFI